MADAMRTLTLLAMLGTGLIAGVFFAFSVFIMPALRMLPTDVGAAAMRSINRVIVRTAFIPLFLANVVVGMGLAALTIARPPVTLELVAAGLAYTVGCFGVTIMGNVPLNNALDAAGDRVTTEAWQDYIDRWTRWNHVRTAASAAACILYGLAR